MEHGIVRRPVRRDFSLSVIILASCVSSWAQPIHDVKRYGARGDGASDDTAAIQKAIDTASRAGGGSVYFPVSSGCYMVAGLTFYSDLVYAGETRDVCIKSIGSSAAMVSTPVSAPFSNAAIVRLTFDGNANSFTGHDCLELRGPTNVGIHEVTTTRCGGDGVYVTGWGAGANPDGQGDGLAITRLISSHNGRNGLSIIAGRNITVRDSLFEQHTISAPFAGVDLEPNAASQAIENVSFENCTFRNNAYNGFTAWEVHADRPNLNLRLIHCTFEDNGRDGAYIAASHHVIGGIYVSGKMTGNKSLHGYRGGLDIWHARNVVVTNLSVADASQSVVLWGVQGATVANSSLSGVSCGLNTSRSTDVRVYTSTSLSRQARCGRITALAGAAPRITTESLSRPALGAGYFTNLSAAGDSPITWAQVAGTLPLGLALSDTGVLAGTPEREGSYTFTVQAQNAITYDEQTYTLTVLVPPGSRLVKFSRVPSAPVKLKAPAVPGGRKRR